MIAHQTLKKKYLVLTESQVFWAPSVSGFKTFHAYLVRQFNVVADLVRVLWRPPFLSLSRSNTKLKSPFYYRIGSRVNSQKNIGRKLGSSSVGAYNTFRFSFYVADNKSTKVKVKVNFI